VLDSFVYVCNVSGRKKAFFSRSLIMKRKQKLNFIKAKHNFSLGRCNNWQNDDRREATEAEGREKKMKWKVWRARLAQKRSLKLRERSQVQSRRKLKLKVAPLFALKFDLFFFSFHSDGVDDSRTKIFPQNCLQKLKTKRMLHEASGKTRTFSCAIIFLLDTRDPK
jgi:hypothetical protein